MAQRKVALRMRERFLHRRLAQMVVAIENSQSHHQRVDDQSETDRVVGGYECGLEAEAIAAGEKNCRYEAGDPAKM